MTPFITAVVSAIVCLSIASVGVSTKKFYLVRLKESKLQNVDPRTNTEPKGLHNEGSSPPERQSRQKLETTPSDQIETSSWSPCSATCGRSVKTRESPCGKDKMCTYYQQCDVPKQCPVEDGEEEKGEEEEKREEGDDGDDGDDGDEVHEGVEREEGVEGNEGEFDWSECSATCGKSYRSRKVLCGKKACVEHQPCDVPKKCPEYDMKPDVNLKKPEIPVKKKPSTKSGHKIAINNSVIGFSKRSKRRKKIRVKPHSMVQGGARRRQG